MRKYLVIGLLAFIVALAGVASATWVGDFLKAGIAVTEDKLTFNSDVEFDGDVTLDGGDLAAASLSDTLQDQLKTLTITDADQEDGTSHVTIQVKDAGGNDLADVTMIRAWTSNSTLGAPVAITGISATTGTVINSHTANGDIDAITDVNGTLVLDCNNGGAGTIHVMGVVNDEVTAEEVVITAGG
jgi:dienelactone hydrolase